MTTITDLLGMTEESALRAEVADLKRQLEAVSFECEMLEQEACATDDLIIALRKMISDAERHIVGLYQTISPGGRCGDENRFADQDRIVQELRKLR